MAVNPVEALINRIAREQGKSGYFDPRLGAAIESARLGLADINRSYGRGTEEARIGYDEASRDLLKQRDETYEQNRGQFAGQGLIHSGIFATEQGKVGEAYQRGLTQAGQRRTSLLQDLANNRLSGYNELQRMLRGEQAGSAERAAQRRRDEAQRRIEAAYRAEQQRMAQAALAVQKQQLMQQRALAGRTGGGGGGGGGGGYYSLQDLFPGMFRAPIPPQKSLKEYTPKKGSTGARVRVM